MVSRLMWLVYRTDLPINWKNKLWVTGKVTKQLQDPAGRLM
jgi:hypothetical protein